MSNNISSDLVSCYCLRNKHGDLHCPLSSDKQHLERTFNYQIRGEDIVQVDIDKSFVCLETRHLSCKYCPFL